MNIHFPANRRHTHAIAIAANAAHHARDEVAHFWVIGPAKPQRIHIGNGAGAHGEDVAQNAADAGCRPLIGFDVGRVIVAFHLEDGGLSIANVDHACIFARAANHPRGGGRQFFQVKAGGFIGAMLRPHDREDTKFGQVRLPTHGAQNACIFFGREAVFGDDFGRDLGHGRALAVEIDSA